ncbi:MAG: dienelactone hydrolase family protein [Stellaceae bacterium]
MSFGFGGYVAVAVLVLTLGTNAAARAAGLEWLGGDTVEVAAHRMGLTPFPEPINHSLLGYLAKPDAPGRHPAVVVLHGCGGFGTYEPVAAEVLKSYGYVALALDSLDGINSCTNRDGATAEAFDAYAALSWLARQDFVDPGRVAVLGFSMGGIAALDDVEAGVGAIEKAEKRHFRAAIAYYPCTRYRAGVMTVPTLILVGEKDDWSPASYCREMMARRAGKGAPVSLIVYPGATHAFNIPAPAREYLGHHLAYDPQATADAWRQVRDFLQATLCEAPPTRPAAESH